MLNPEALLYDVPLLHRSVPAAAELRGITIKNEKEILETIKTRVGSNGQISVGKKHAGKFVTAYVVICDMNE